MNVPHSLQIRILCIDDHPLVRKGLASIIAQQSDMQLIAEGENGEQAIRLFRQHRPDVTLMDLRMPVMDGIGAVQEIRQEFPEARIIALTSYDGDQDIYRALEAGVRGYLLKETVHAEIVSAIRTVHAGRKLVSQDAAQRLAEYFPQAALTPREIEVLELVAKGMSNKVIAVKLGTAGGTIKMHVQNILAKLDATDRTHAVTTALKRGIIHL